MDQAFHNTIHMTIQFCKKTCGMARLFNNVSGHIVIMTILTSMNL